MSEIAEHIKELVSELKQQQVDQNNKHTENVRRFTQIEGSLSHLDECMDDLKKKLFGGNGQEGVLNSMESRINTLEKWAWRILGAMWAIGAIAQVVAMYRR